jgi:hypothetical protein
VVLHGDALVRGRAQAHAARLARVLPVLVLSACSLLLDTDSPPCRTGSPCQTAGSAVSSAAAGVSGGGNPAGSGVRDDVCTTDADCISILGMTRCDPDGDGCVECLSNADCPMAVCNTTRHVCEDCLRDDDCQDRAAARCNQTRKKCGGCLADEDCEHFPDTPVCERVTKTCVQCTADVETACNGTVCDLDTYRCSAQPRGAKALCEPCRFDSECPSGTMPVKQREAACVRMTFRGSPHGSYCLRRDASACMPPYISPTEKLVSTSGAPAQAYCGVAQDVTTCEAVRALGAASCLAGADTQCGSPMVDDGICRTVKGAANQCTYVCSAPTQCPAGYMCTDNYCQ